MSKKSKMSKMSKMKRKRKITLASIIGFAIGLSVTGAGIYIVTASEIYAGYAAIGLGICMLVLIFYSL